MLKKDRNSPPFLRKNRRVVLTAAPVLFLLVTLIVPMTASCQRAHSGDADGGIRELRALVAGAAGKPDLNALVRIEKSYPRTRGAALARFLRGYLLYSAQDYTGAAAALDAQAVAAHSALGDYAHFYRAESKAAAGAMSDALRDFTEVYMKHPDSLRAREARLRAAEMAMKLGDPASALRELAELTESKDADALFIAAQVSENTGKNEEAVKLYRRIYFEMPATTASVRAEERLKALGASPAENPGSFAEQRSRADGLYKAKQYTEAARAYEALTSAFPDAEKNDEIQLRYGISLLNGKQPAQAVLPLSKVSDRNAEMRANALFHQAEALRRAGRAGEAGVVVDRLLSQHARAPQAQEALYDLASYLNKRSGMASAAGRYRQLMALYPRSEYAAEASWLLGWQAYQAGSYADAARMLEQHLANYRYPETKFIGEAGFWAARSHERLGNRARALALYEIVAERYRYGYHGYLAQRRAASLRANDAGIKPEPIKPGSDLERIRSNALYVGEIQETANGSESNRLAKADDLEVIGLSDLAIKEVNQALASAPDSPRLNLRLAQIYARRGENFQATLILRKGYPDIYSYRDADLPRDAWEIFFPLNNWETIKQEAKRYGIDPYFAAGLIRQESVFNPDAISRVGARGLMQVMPATGQLVAKRQGAGSITAADLHNPSLNIKLGMNYLAQMIGQFGRLEYAAAAYNAGPGRAKQWIAQRGSMDIEEWVENIPFSETRGYVMGVLRYAANYRRFYKE
ncbi:MAG TPA: transglycosylase SLT domain-containing protein [Blastocatellia bacterium]|nr:transglycosylase SLT domain-containing protein [Blastocatellia bacterium]